MYNDKISPIINTKKLKPALFLDVLKAVLPHKDILLSIDLKTQKEEEVLEVIQILREFKILDRCIVGTMKEMNIRKLKKENKCEDVAFFGSFNHCGKAILYFILGFLPFWDFDCDIFAFPYYFESISKLFEKPKFKDNKILKYSKNILDKSM